MLLIVLCLMVSPKWQSIIVNCFVIEGKFEDWSISAGVLVVPSNRNCDVQTTPDYCLTRMANEHSYPCQSHFQPGSTWRHHNPDAIGLVLDRRDCDWACANVWANRKNRPSRRAASYRSLLIFYVCGHLVETKHTMSYIFNSSSSSFLRLYSKLSLGLTLMKTFLNNFNK